MYQCDKEVVIKQSLKLIFNVKDILINSWIISVVTGIVFSISGRTFSYTIKYCQYGSFNLSLLIKYSHSAVYSLHDINHLFPF